MRTVDQALALIGATDDWVAKAGVTLNELDGNSDIWEEPYG